MQGAGGTEIMNERLNLFVSLLKEDNLWRGLHSKEMAPVGVKEIKLTEVSFERIRNAGMNDLYDLSEMANIQDDGNLVHSEDLRERLILIKRKMEGISNTWKHLFKSVKEETEVKSECLIDLMNTVEATFQMCPIGSLSEVLRKEGHLQNRNLQQELSKRMKNLKERRSLIVIAGETNGGKSSFLNLLLGEDILPTDVLHCTFVVCKIVYSETYSIKTLDHNDHVEHIPCTSLEETKAILKANVSKQEMKDRIIGSPFKEITLGLPADILKSGVTLVDTPGIGENEHMDNVTMNFVKSTHASAFIYIIKSDTAGGVQEDRLLSFLRAIKERYSADTEVETFDPRAATFICHRWDNIDDQQKEKVKRNALSKLEYVWPGFEPSQTFFFSTKDTMKHLPVDSEFVTDSFMMLLKGLKKLFERASHNAIKHQYLWLKYMLQPASRHLRSMISYCIHNNDELEMYFKSLAIKQNKLMVSSAENSKILQTDLDEQSTELKKMIASDLDFGNISISREIHDSGEIIETCSKKDLLKTEENRQLLDEMIIRCLLKYVDEHLLERKVVYEMDTKILMAIQRHLGLFGSQISQIKYAMLHGGSTPLPRNSSRTDFEVDNLEFGVSTMSIGSERSNGSSIESLREEMILDTTQLALTVKSLLVRRKHGKLRKNINIKHEFQESLMSKIKSKVWSVFHQPEPEIYVEERLHKISKKIRHDDEILDNIVQGYTEWIQQCVNYATNSIPKFIEVNNKLMDEIREHRNNFQRNKDLLRKIMEDLEPSRHYLRGYGLLYMDDINAEMLAFNIEQRHSLVTLPSDLIPEPIRNDDSGFQGSGSRRRKVQSFWTKMQGATIMIDNMAERVVVKTYNYDMDEKTILLEIASLRCLDYTNLAPFLGMTRIAATGSTRGESSQADTVIEKVSAFIFKGDLISAHVHSKRRLTNMQYFVPDLIQSLLKGLNYIHREGLVHMELNLNTVMVERVSGAVKLCQMCKPREARLPASLNELTQHCVCLSPNVLQGHVYESTDDIYAFGLLLWELLFPDAPPYKVQRLWPLSRFIAECHPTSMLQEELMQLEVSENVREVLKRTLLVSRGNICMSIATVESLLVDISKESAVRHLRSRPERFAYRRSSSGHSSVIDLVNKNAPGIQIMVPVQTLPVESSPKRPHRMKDKISPSTSLDEPEINIEITLFPWRKERRQTEPAILMYHPSSPSVKSKKSLLSIMGGAFRRRSSKIQLDAELESPDESASVCSNSYRRESDDTDGDKNSASNDNAYSSPPLKPIIFSSSKKKVEANSKPNSRRFSLQEQSLIGPKKVNLSRDDSFDVPSLMSKKFATNWNRSLTREDAPSTNTVVDPPSGSFLNDSIPSLLITDMSSRNAEFYSKYHLNKRLKSEVFTPGNVSVLDDKLFGSRLGRSLQDLPRPSAHQTRQVGPQSQDKLETADYHHSLERYSALGQRLGISLQDVSGTRHITGTILEDSVDTSVSDYEKANITGHPFAKSYVKRNSGHRRWSPPAVSGQPKKLSSLDFPNSESISEENFGSSSSVVSSTSSSLRKGSWTFTDVAGQRQKDAPGFLNEFDIGCNSDPETASRLLDPKAYKRFNNRENPSFGSNKYQHTSTEKLQDTSKSQNFNTIENNIAFSNSSKGYSRDSLKRSVHFSFKDENRDSELVSQKYTPSQPPSIPHTQHAPPPPVINFAKLLFGKGDEYDDEGYPFV